MVTRRDAVVVTLSMMLQAEASGTRFLLPARQKIKRALSLDYPFQCGARGTVGVDGKIGDVHSVRPFDSLIHLI